MKKSLLQSSLIVSLSLAFMLLLAPTDKLQHTESKVIYLHKQNTQKCSPEVLLNSFIKTGKVIVIFYADWCPPCKGMASFIEDLAQEYPEYTFVKINVDHFPDLKAQFKKQHKLTTIPAIFIFNNGIALNSAPYPSMTKGKMIDTIKAAYIRC